MTPIDALPTATGRSLPLAKHPTLGNQGVVATSDRPPASQAVTRLATALRGVGIYYP